MSHFIIWSKAALFFGTPKGQVITQLLQPLHCGCRELWTIPSGVFLIVSAGQTRAQIGFSQCMQTWGAVCTESRRWMVSKWIIDCPRCVSHSAQAWTHAWQPIQRE